MVTHYSPNGSDIACGRNTPNVVSCANPEEVSCKSCLKSLGKTDAAPKAAKNTTPSLAEIRQQRMQAQAAAKAQPKPGFCFHANWRQRLTALPNTCRLPRGSANAQPFV
ncbi:hypothetical protein RAM80_06340 [Pseudomonas sp. App30]|uniref:hypothetical protein n=1 Tax=Pseudomonas sp. App30 TaxID=3068990 RepID=UPI003A7FFED0